MKSLLPDNEPEDTCTFELLERNELSGDTFELAMSRPSAFNFLPGQRIRILHGDIERDYSIISTPQDEKISLCVRRVEDGKFSPYLTSANPGQKFIFEGPLGYFTFQSSERPSVFVATGTGLAPFISMARSGVRGFTLLHGVSRSEDSYYEALWEETSDLYVQCLSDTAAQIRDFKNIFGGRVTDYLVHQLPCKPYDFYLCGSGEMIRDAIYIIDELFHGSFVRTEIYY